MTMLTRTDDGAVAHLRMTAPERLNALSDAMLSAFQRAFDDLAADRSIRAVILSGEGRAFCAGHDLKEMQAARQAEDAGAAYFADLFARCAALMLTIRRLPQPVIAQVEGVAAAAGAQLVASCDMAVAAAGARFGVNGVNIGLFCSTPMVPLSRTVPAKAAFEMLTTGRMIAADEALRLGLVNRVAAAEDVADETAALADTVAAKLGGAVRIGKRAFYDQAALSEEEAYAFASEVMVRNMMEADTDEGIDAFLGKRPPDWAQT